MQGEAQSPASSVLPLGAFLGWKLRDRARAVQLQRRKRGRRAGQRSVFHVWEDEVESHQQPSWIEACILASRCSLESSASLNPAISGADSGSRPGALRLKGMAQMGGRATKFFFSTS